MTRDIQESLSRKEQQKQECSTHRWKLCSGVFMLHVIIIGVPLLWVTLDKFFRPPKVNAFRVKIGPKELSHAPLVGQPERTRPQPNSGRPLPSEPAVPVPVPAEPKVRIPKPKPKPKPKRKKKTVRKKTVRKNKRIARKIRKKPVKPKRNLQSGVYRPPKGTNELREIGGRNFNRNVPIGSRDRGQVQGKADHRTPGGGLTEEMTAYNRRAGMYLKNVWVQPPKSLLGNQLPAVTIELEIARDGRVTARKILRPSGVAAMDDSVKNLLRRLDRMPAPPAGNAVIQFILQTDD